MTTINLSNFFLAAQTGNIDVLKFCLENGIDIHSHNDLALRKAKENGQVETVIFLLKNGANINVFCNDDKLRFSSAIGDYKTVNELLQKNSCSRNAKTYAMYNAIFYGHTSITKLLLDNGVSPTDNNGAILKVLKLCKSDEIIALFEEYLN